MQIKDPKPEIMRLEELALLVKSGDIKLPRFQRPFVWLRTDMLKLLDSIYKGYPIGSILIWNSSQKLISERSISGLSVNTDEKTLFPTNYLLDGQQRLTTLCGALFWGGAEENSIWNIHFDLDSETFVYPKDTGSVNLFPLNKLIQTSDFIRQCMKFEHHGRREHYFATAERLLKSIKDYKIAVVKIGDMTIDEVAPIFERINSTGRKLTMVDLMMAATWSDGFDLTAAIARIRAVCKERAGFDEIPDVVILRSIAASADLGINKDDIQRLRSLSADALSKAAVTAESCILAALLFLRDSIGIHDYSYIPYGIQLSYIAEYFRLSAERSSNGLPHLSAWFWYTSATRYFATSSNTGQVTKDLSVIRAFASGKAAHLFDIEPIDITRLLFDKFNLRNATSTTFTSLLNNMRPQHTVDGRPIDTSHLKIKSSKFYVSFSPVSGNFQKHNLSKIVNPYTDENIVRNENVTPERLAAHLLNDRCLAAIRQDNPGEYLAERAGCIAARLRELTGCAVAFRAGAEYGFSDSDSFYGIDEVEADSDSGTPESI